jgi:site-specific recombinase XerD
MKRSSRATTLTKESIEQFRNSLSAKGKSERTAKAYSTDLRVLLAELETDQLSMEEFEEAGMNWLTANRSRVAAKTTNRRLTSLKQFARWADWPVSFDEYSAPTPLKGQPHPLPEGTDGVKRMILHAHDERHAALIALCGLCGLRIAEALEVRASDFDLHHMTLTVRGKGDKQRIVPVSTYAWDVLQRPVARSFCASDKPVIGLQDRHARAIVTRLGIKAGLVRHVASHDLRATFATAVYDKTQDQRLVQLLLGHASGSTTEIYIGRTFDQMKAGVEL